MARGEACLGKISREDRDLTPTRDTQVSNQLVIMSKCIEDLMTQIEKLHERLLPVLDTSPKPAEGCVEEKEQYRVPHAKELSERSRKIQAATHIVRGMIDSLEL